MSKNLLGQGNRTADNSKSRGMKLKKELEKPMDNEHMREKGRETNFTLGSDKIKFIS